MTYRMNFYILILLILPSTTVFAQSIISEYTEIESDGSSYTYRTVELAEGFVVDLKMIPLDSGEYLIRSSDQSDRALAIIDSFCALVGAEVAIPSESVIGAMTIAALPCAIHNKDKALPPSSSTTTKKYSEDNMALTNDCGNAWALVDLEGASSVTTSGFAMYMVTGTFEWQNTLHSQEGVAYLDMWPGCSQTGVSTFGNGFGQLILPRGCIAPGSPTWISGTGGASICYASDMTSLNVYIVNP